MSRIAATLLSIEVVVLFLAAPVALNASAASTGAVWAALGAVVVLCVAAAATVRRSRLGYVLGTVAQLATIATGVLAAPMFVLGGIFALLWVLLLRIGPAVERRADRPTT